MQTPTDEDVVFDLNVFLVQDSALTAAAPVTTLLISASPLDKVRLAVACAHSAIRSNLLMLCLLWQVTGTYCYSITGSIRLSLPFDLTTKSFLVGMLSDKAK